ncbi:hypothetical protein D3C85_1822590 [compost metagenome]
MIHSPLGGCYSVAFLELGSKIGAAIVPHHLGNFPDIHVKIRDQQRLCLLQPQQVDEIGKAAVYLVGNQPAEISGA